MSASPPTLGREIEVPALPPAAPDLLDGRVVLITGAGDGLGKALALACAARGAEVVLLDRVVRKLEAVYDQIMAASYREPAIYPMDLEGAEPGHYEELASRLHDNFGGLDALVNNAARLGQLSPVEHYDLVEWAKVMQVNLNAPFLLSRACLPLLRARGDARLVMVSDAVGRRGKAYWGGYGASKFALEGLMEVLAEELEHDGRVKVCSVDPGPVRTSLRASAFPAENRDGLALPEDVAGGFLHVLGPQGQELHGARVSITC